VNSATFNKTKVRLTADQLEDETLTRRLLDERLQ